ncbi:MAG: hypothetical protein AAGE86_14445 [Pseudomonadota bacterium]
MIGTKKTPWHLWAVGVVGLLWNSGGANDYIQVNMRVESYLAQGAEMLGITGQQVAAYYDAFPVWANISWALGVWGAIAGSMLLLLRSKFAFLAFLLSLIGLGLTTIYTIGTPMPMAPDAQMTESAKTFQRAFSAAIWLATLLLMYYSYRMTKAGVLK